MSRHNASITGNIYEHNLRTVSKEIFSTEELSKTHTQEFPLLDKILIYLRLVQKKLTPYCGQGTTLFSRRSTLGHT